MHSVALFVEDYAHREIIGTLVRRLADEQGIKVRLDWHSAVGGHGRVAQELGLYLRDLGRQAGSPPYLIVVATDANCRGFQERLREIRSSALPPARIVHAIPDPHVERWLLLDGAAFKAVVGRGCNAPDLKCDRGRYKKILIEAVRDAGVSPIIGGIEYASDIVQMMNIDRAMRMDQSLARFVKDIRAAFRYDPM